MRNENLIVVAVVSVVALLMTLGLVGLNANAKRIQADRQAEQERLIAEQEERERQEKLATEQRKQEEQRRQEMRERQRLAEEQRQQEVEKQRRLAEEREREEQERQRLAAEQRKWAEEQARLAAEQEKQRLVAEQKKQEEETLLQKINELQTRSDKLRHLLFEGNGMAREEYEQINEELRRSRETIQRAEQQRKEEERQKKNELALLAFSGDAQALAELTHLVIDRDEQALEIWRRERAEFRRLASEGDEAAREKESRLVAELNRQNNLKRPKGEVAPSVAGAQRRREREEREQDRRMSRYVPPANYYQPSLRPQIRSSATADFYNISPYGGQSSISGYSEIPNPFGGRPIRSNFNIDTDVQIRNGKIYGTSNLVIE